MRYSITIELDANSAEEAISLVAVGEIVELLNLDLLMHPPNRVDVEQEPSDKAD